MRSSYTEDHQVEQPAINCFVDLGWKYIKAYQEELRTSESDGTLGRETRDEVVLSTLFKRKLTELNPSIPDEQIQEVVKEFTRDRSSMHSVRANKEIYELLRDGVDLEYRDNKGDLKQETVHIIDWKTPENNDFLLASQFWVA